MAESNPRKRAEIISPFTDAGTGERFTAGDTPMIDAGAFTNYEHAGLVRAPAPTKTKAAADRPKRKAAPKTSRPRTRRGKAVAAAPAAAPASAEPAAAPDAGGDGASA